jgi:O-antigen/teichoic acid export membrane protein
MPTARALFPIYASIQNEAERLKAAYLNVLSSITIISCATGIGVALVAQDLVPVLLGPKWLAAVPLVQWLAAASALNAISSNALGVLQATGRAALCAYMNIANAALTYGTLLTLALIYVDPAAVAAGRFAVTVVFVIPMFLCLRGIFSITFAEIFKRLRSPFAAGLTMVMVVRACHPVLPADHAVRLVSEIIIGAVTYIATLLFLRSIFGESSFEKGFLQSFNKRIARIFSNKRA